MYDTITVITITIITVRYRTVLIMDDVALAYSRDVGNLAAGLAVQPWSQPSPKRKSCISPPLSQLPSSPPPPPPPLTINITTTGQRLLTISRS